MANHAQSSSHTGHNVSPLHGVLVRVRQRVSMLENKKEREENTKEREKDRKVKPACYLSLHQYWKHPSLYPQKEHQPKALESKFLLSQDVLQDALGQLMHRLVQITELVPKETWQLHIIMRSRSMQALMPPQVNSFHHS